MRFPRSLLGLVTGFLLVGAVATVVLVGVAAAGPHDAPPPEPALWDDGVRPEPRALDARVGAGCAHEPSVTDDQLLASPGAGATGIDAMCTWRAPDDGAGAAPQATLQ